MTKRYTRSNTTTAELVADYLDQRDEEVMQALVTAGAFVAFADGRVEAIERDELVNYIHRQRLVPTISQRDIAEAFDNRVRQLEDRDSASVMVETFRPLAGLSLSSVVVSTAGAGRGSGPAHASQRIAGHEADMPDHDEFADQEAARVKRFMIIGSRGSLDGVDQRFAVHAVNLAQGPSLGSKGTLHDDFDAP
jgi:hypothetical protein